MNYQKLYTAMFNAVTNAIEHMEHQNYGKALEELKTAQINAEDLYIGAEET
ncbi:MAG: hypothetical protein J6J43_06830 [Oscillospiraceae bacterium]|nr:hypothetical protein [Oscillospiraceae bacterium]